MRTKIYGAALNKVVAAAESYSYHSRHRNEARQLVASMTAVAGVRQSAALFRQCDEYADDVLGSKRYSPWLKAYTVLAGTFKEGWIPDDYYGEVVVPRLQGNYGAISHYKAISSRLFQTDLLPDLAYAANGLLYTSSLEPLKPDELKNYLFAHAERIVYKPDNAGLGKSILVYDADSFPDAPVIFNNGVFQSYITQHPFFDAFNNQSVCTIRITTVVDDESNASCRAAYLRLPRSGETHVKSATAIKVAMNLRGELQDKGYLPDWVPIARHPDSGQPFARQIVPDFERCIITCISLHKKVMFSRIIGWDIILDENRQVVVMEWNGIHNGIKFSEATSGPCFADLGWQNLWRIRE